MRRGGSVRFVQHYAVGQLLPTTATEELHDALLVARGLGHLGREMEKICTLLKPTELPQSYAANGILFSSHLLRLSVGDGVIDLDLRRRSDLVDPRRSGCRVPLTPGVLLEGGGRGGSTHVRHVVPRGQGGAQVHDDGVQTVVVPRLGTGTARPARRRRIFSSNTTLIIGD